MQTVQACRYSRRWRLRIGPISPGMTYDIRRGDKRGCVPYTALIWLQAIYAGLRAIHHNTMHRTTTSHTKPHHISLTPSSMLRTFDSSPFLTVSAAGSPSRTKSCTLHGSVLITEARRTSARVSTPHRCSSRSKTSLAETMAGPPSGPCSYNKHGEVRCTC